MFNFLCNFLLFFLLQEVVVAGFHAGFNLDTVPPETATRHTRGPVYFKFVRVHYDKVEGKVTLTPRRYNINEASHIDFGDKDDTEVEDEDNDLTGTTYT